MRIADINEAVTNQEIIIHSDEKTRAEETDDKKKQVKEEKELASEKAKKSVQDFMTISEEAKQMFLKQLEDSKKENPYEDLIKLIEIANRIAKGDKVPLSDEKKLLEKEPDMYLSAKMAATLNKDKKHKNHKALFEDEENGGIEEELRELKREESMGSGESAEVTVEAAGDSSGMESGGGENL
ncbi:MAG: hypothetical protein HFE59_00395 [Clostridiales bacterium]|nr:hypothetical protein [Clostridiales bacterium]